MNRCELQDAFSILSEAHEGYLEIVDETSARPTGRVARWELVHSAGLWHGSVAVLVADSQGRVALQCRGESDSHGKWDVSVAGHLDVGESDVQAAVRETREELGLDIDSAKLVRVGRPYQYWKVGSPEITRDRHESANQYVYWKKNKNRERISLFVVRVSERMKRHIRGPRESGALSIAWKTIQEANELASDRSRECASSLKQFFTAKVMLRRIEKVLRQTKLD